jgi:hypothetical protein
MIMMCTASGLGAIGSAASNCNRRPDAHLNAHATQTGARTE